MSNHALPWLRFYPADWLKDPALSAASLAAQGAWMRLLCHMHEATPRGYLCDSNGQPFSDKQLARLVGCAPQTVRKLVKELIDLGVVSVSKDDHQTQGILYSRRMVRDDLKLQQDRENGKKGGNPNVTNGVNPPVKGGVGNGLRLDPDSDTDTDSKTEKQPSSSAPVCVNQASSSSSPHGNATTVTNVAHPSLPEPTKTGDSANVSQKSVTSVTRWEEVEEALKDVGIDHFGKAAKTARELGRSPEFCFELIEYFKLHQQRAGWKHGALFQRIMFAENLPPDRGWPEMANPPQSLPSHSPKPDDLEQLELKFGATLNAFTPAQLAELFSKAVAAAVETKDRPLLEVAKDAKRLLEFGTSLTDPKFRGPALKVLRRCADRKGAATT